jgi:hypothetical protein
MLRLVIWRMKVFVGPLIVLLIFQACSATPSAERGPQLSSAPDEVVRQFYDWYLHARFPNPGKENEAQFQKYVTAKLLREAMAPDVDAVLFIAAQDADPTWAHHFTVSKATIRNQIATVRVFLRGEKVHYTLRITLKRENGAWKIDEVKGSGWKAPGS